MGKRREKRYYSLKARKKICRINQAKITTIDHKDVELLRNFITVRGKMISARNQGISTRNQRLIAQAIKRARMLALLSFREGLPKPAAVEPAGDLKATAPQPVSDEQVKETKEAVTTEAAPLADTAEQAATDKAAETPTVVDKDQKS